MDSLEMEKGASFSDENGVKEMKSEVGIEKNENSNKKEEKKSELGTEKDEIRYKKTRRKRFSICPRFACMRLDDEVPAVVETPAGECSFNVESSQKGPPPPHLVVMVNGIIGSADDWKYAAKQFVKAYPRDIIVHCSTSNCSRLTFDGVDIMGTRLAEEVLSVIKQHPHLQKISFVGHSLGGLICRYAIAKLYEQKSARRACGEDMECSLDGSTNSSVEEVSKRKIAGLEPVNFITCATPHLGCRGHKQAPAFCGLYSFENAAASSSWLLGRSGRHLFLKDSDEGKPLLLRMASDSEDLPFISALQSFQRCVAYANTCFDYLVGWSTSSLRRRSELPKRRNLKKVDKYPHIVNIDKATSVSSQEEIPADAKIKGRKSQEMEEAMIRGLTKVSWERVDVSFKGSKQRHFAHTAIQVQSYCINSDGADVIQHMIDNFTV